MNSIKINEDNIKKRLDVFLVDYFEKKYPRSNINNAIENQLFLVNGKVQKSD